MKRRSFLTFLLLITVSAVQAEEHDFPFRNPDLPMDTRIADLLGRLKLKEKVLMMKHESPAIERLGVPAYNWWNEALHGVARTTERVTVFPQAIGMAATFDTAALQKMGDITATEGRALFNEDLRLGNTGKIYRGLTYWTPNINIFRDPRWGRGQETYGEDPYLTAKMGSAMVRGLQGNHPTYYKAVACAKHFAVHSGPEHNRHEFDACTTPYDLWDTYLPAFRELVVKAKVGGMMCAYNRWEGKPCCGHNELLQGILRNQWNFDGYVTSDCWAVSDFTKYHKTHSSSVDAVADALLAGTDLECGNLYQRLEQGVEQGLITEREINLSLARLLRVLFRLGLFDPAERVPYSTIGREVIECDIHQQHAYEMAQKSMVLLKNEKRLLPLNPKKITRIALIGPNIDNEHTLLANYYGTPSEIITPYKALQARYGGQIVIDTLRGVDFVTHIEGAPDFAAIAARANKADVILFVGGISADYEGEAGDAGAGGYAGFASGDRTTIELPTVQTELMKALKKRGKPMVLINMSGSVMSFGWESQHVDAILQAWYGGQAAGDAIVDVLFGHYNPAGRMPLTTYKSDDDLPDFEEYSMVQRTYRYFQGEVRYPFGYGLSYTTFSYRGIEVPEQATCGETVEVSAEVINSGKRDGDEVVQLYVAHPQSKDRLMPIHTLKGFTRIHLKAGETKRVKFQLLPEDLAWVDEQGNLKQQAGVVTLHIGGGQPSQAHGVSVELELVGDSYTIY